MLATTPRSRFEIDRPRVRETRRPIPLVTLTTSFQTILTARDDADFFVRHRYVCEWSTAARTVDICLVPPGDTAGTANAIVYLYAITSNAVELVMGGSELLVPPEYTLQARASANDSLNIYGWGVDAIGSETNGL
jgi:hypothetical protein